MARASLKDGLAVGGVLVAGLTCVVLHCQVGCAGRGATPPDVALAAVAPLRSDAAAVGSGATTEVVLVVEGFQKARSGAT